MFGRCIVSKYLVKKEINDGQFGALGRFVQIIIDPVQQRTPKNGLHYIPKDGSRRIVVSGVGMSRTMDKVIFSPENVVTITLPRTVLECGEYAFVDTHSLLSVILSPNLRKIGAECFKNTGIRAMHLPSFLEVVESNAL